MARSYPFLISLGFVSALFLGIANGERIANGEEPDITYADLVTRLYDLERLATPVVPGVKTAASTSHDRRMSYDPNTDTYRHWSANSDGGGCLRREGDTQVMVDLEGAGVLWRTWSAAAKGGHIKIYLDGRETPVIDKPFGAYFDDLEKDYPGLAMTLSRGRNEFIPISFSKSCKVTLDKGWGAYFHCTHTLFPDGTKVEPFPGLTPEVVKLLKKASDVWSKRGESPYVPVSTAVEVDKTLSIEPGSTQAISLTGAGAIRALKIKPLELPEDKITQEDVLRELTLSIYWDGEASPSVWAPLGDFFATSPGLNAYKTLPMGCVDGQFYCFWYLPYADGAKIVVTNGGKATRRLEVQLETIPLEKAAAAKLLRFRAVWHGDDFTSLDAKRFKQRGGDRWPDWPLLAVEGKGRYVGMTEHIWKFGGWWGEGDEKFFIDGEKYPSTVGTGSEDYIGYAWAANPPFVTFDSGLAAVSRLRPDAQEDTSVCRFHVCDDLPFAESFQGFIEVMPNGNCRPCLYDTCVYWYAEQGAKNPYPIVPLSGRLHTRPPRERRDVVPSTMTSPQTPPPAAAAREGAIEGEGLKVVRCDGGRHWVQNMRGYRGGTWSGGNQLIWTNGDKGQSIVIEFQVPQRGEYDVKVRLTKAIDYGIFQLYLNEEKVAEPIDLYGPNVVPTDEISLGKHTLEQGKHTLRAEAIGHNAKAKALRVGRYLFGLDYMTLTPNK